ncbi:Peroxisomal membrane protein PEX14 [Orchesella cincta]|uniref:Peroxisomal membrane protein PEX14 n=1 Tax=Orchesella cincta TaxID=48709 RepID=A0A1D2MSK8_ORCCI|nr:Peroxisomal membrane protein PEX14 [Orchesella cincta]
MDATKNDALLSIDSSDPVGEPIREHLVTTAVKFLQNPRVRPTTLAQKQAFLRKKGLSDLEIETACEQAGLQGGDLNNNIMSSKSSIAQLIPTVNNYHQSRTSLWIKAKDVANMVALISIGSYSLYSLWKSYIAPRIFGTRTRHDQKYEQLLTSIMQLNESVCELKQLIKESHLQGLQTAKAHSRSFEIQELKSELVAIKSLLLSRSQFSSPPAIPSWQLVDANEGDNSNENSDESTSRRRKNKADRGRKEDLTAETDVESERGIRKHPSLDSNNGFQSGSSCEVVFLPKTDSDHSDE